VSDRVVVTGSQGLLGRYLVARWLRRNPRVRVLGLGRSPRLKQTFVHDLEWLGNRVPAPLPPELENAEADPRYRYERVNLRDGSRLSEVLDDFRPDVIVHAAAALRGEQWERLVESNILSLVVLLETIAASRWDLTRLVLVSSGSVYGARRDDELPLKESASCTPTDLYSVTKRAAEDIARVFAYNEDLPIVVARVFNLLGAGLQDQHVAASLARQVAAMKLGIAPPTISVGPLDTSRDFIDVRDAAGALIVLAESGESRGVYNVGSGRETAIRLLFDTLMSMSGLRVEPEIRPSPRRKLDYARSYADIRRLRALGSNPRISLRESMGDMLAYYTEAVASLAS
jgi:GDP-4-dehydro-6-deoxy-D-mannose reductase